MDYEFRHDIGGQVIALFSMGHEAVGHWLNEEVKGDLALLSRIEQEAAALKGSERQWQLEGHEYTLWLDSEEVMVRANQLALEGDALDDGMRYYDEESLSLCGLEDFLQVLARYRSFIQQR
ncbi:MULTISPECIES: YacL family protein [Edwardsiella]|uniref:UPF0231 protein ETEE_2433 n=2 Tax=Edwardsiella anguillarum TaxID=1821960 RepID=A0A076LTF6_9GAMM|nr:MULTISPECIES: YacL family protein [Edwardsiella]AKM48766.1 hypothetical protein QY76_16960 [Edwardsiella sp. EA181011]GAJ66833.1 hypothetical protein MA13_contig00003-0173 [Edwardsiella piscicida]AIJ08874.1 Hypothetical protein ETEE_2433 [Edwardsiella anguillarum ET080813]AKR76869.1 YacL family protein [Edwardsiella sp. LADL05-105]KAB0592363.1 UPF0231 family protein [Edwardsiella anguillarum]